MMVQRQERSQSCSHVADASVCYVGFSQGTGNTVIFLSHWARPSQSVKHVCALLLGTARVAWVWCGFLPCLVFYSWSALEQNSLLFQLWNNCKRMWFLNVKTFKNVEILPCSKKKDLRGMKTGQSFLFTLLASLLWDFSFLWADFF